MSIHILHVVGARPNFMKAASVLRALGNAGFRQSLVHTGQHYDANMSDVFFRELEIPEPDVNLAVGSGSHAEQTARIMTGFESVVLERKPDLVVVYGDVNSTVAAALVCAKLQIPVAHVEAGLRSNDRSMPEEINRLLTDQLSDLLFTPSDDADRNLQREGIPVERIRLVGNVMIDTLVHLLPRALERKSNDLPAHYALVTLHRPSNVDDPDVLRRILSSILSVSKNKDANNQDLAVVFPMHPRTRVRVSQFGMATDGLHICDPLSYLEFLALQAGATVVLTDSGGIQEETTFLGVPCLTLRANTERPVTVEIGTNVLIGNDTDRLRTELAKILNGQQKKGVIPPLWDGHAGERIARILQEYFEKRVQPAAAVSS
jgi:UDP-N-acetylglucosamine 2-epimerase (non-hydrolysing)